MTQRLLGFDRATGLAQWWLEDGDGNWAQKSSQVATPILDLNKEAANHCDPYNAARDVRMVARIPLYSCAQEPQLWRCFSSSVVGGLNPAATSGILSRI